MNRVELALLRSWIQGVPWSEIGALYLDTPDPGEAMRVVKRLRQHLHRKASLLRREADAALWGKEREYRPAWIHAALASLEALYALSDPTPRADDPYGHWFPQAIAGRLGVVIEGTTLEDVANFMNAQGIGWWKTVPRLTHASADTVLAFFKQFAAELALVIELKPSAQTQHAHALSPVSDRIVPLERFLPPASLSGATGTNRAALERCRLNAEHDYAAVMAWLSLWDEQSATYRAYRKEAERWMLWAILAQRKPLSSLTTPDCAAYRRFLADPQPRERWIGKPAPRGSPAWRPFKGPLKPSSSRQAEVILSALCAWLVEQRYLDSNPFTGLSKAGIRGNPNVLDRVLSPALWAYVLDFAHHQATHDAFTATQRSDYRQTAFILTFAYQTGLRLQEMVNARLGDLKRYTHTDGEQWWLQVLGKGNKPREIPISPSLLAAIHEQFYLRKLGAISKVNPETPIIGKRRANNAKTTDNTHALSASSVYKRLKRLFEQAAEQLQASDPIGAEQLKKASTHWLRHTHGSHAVEKGVPLEIVRDNLGHSSIATTSIYIHTDRDRRYQLMTEKMA